MVELGQIVQKIRSKNAGPFWLTIDLFCGTQDTYLMLVAQLPTRQIADAFDVDEASIKRFDLPSLNVIKFSLPRPQIQGSIVDRDMHGASWAALLSELEIVSSRQS